MAGGAACLSNSNTRIIVCQIVTYIIMVRQIVTFELHTHVIDGQGVVNFYAVILPL